jgi:hypothetical protein
MGCPQSKHSTITTLKVSVFDKAGNESNEVVFPFTFESGAKDPNNYQLPPPFDQGDLQDWVISILTSMKHYQRDLQVLGQGIKPYLI